MSTFRRIDSFLDGKTSDQLASDVAARAREQAEQDQRSVDGNQHQLAAGRTRDERSEHDRIAAGGAAVNPDTAAC